MRQEVEPQETPGFKKVEGKTPVVEAFGISRLYSSETTLDRFQQHGGGAKSTMGL